MKSIAFLIAITGAFLVNLTYPPIVTMANQLLAILGWGLVLALAPVPALQRSTLRAVAPLLIVIAMAAAGCAIGIAMRKRLVASATAQARNGLSVLIGLADRPGGGKHSHRGSEG